MIIVKVTKNPSPWQSVGPTGSVVTVLADNVFPRVDRVSKYLVSIPVSDRSGFERLIKDRTKLNLVFPFPGDFSMIRNSADR